jgi:hypothetical protein
MRCPRLHRPNSMNGPRPNAPTIWDSYALPDAWRSQPIQSRQPLRQVKRSLEEKWRILRKVWGVGTLPGPSRPVFFMGPRSYSAVLSRIVPFWMPAESAHSGESTQHSLEVWSQESSNLNSFWDADLDLQVQTAFCPKNGQGWFCARALLGRLRCPLTVKIFVGNASRL